MLIRADARALPLADASVDLIVTSPPYWALRSYTDGGEHYDGQIGAEATPAAYIDSLIECTREWMRVLKPSGSIFVNLGDKYVADNRGSGRDAKRGDAKYAPAGPAGFVGQETARQKSLIGLPWRYALRCIDDLGLILRAEIIWSKPNGLPESVTDRVRRSHEQWFSLQAVGAGDVVEPGAEGFPFCPLCGRPKDARATLVARLHELESRVQDPELPDEVGSDERVQLQDSSGAEEERVVGLPGSPVPLAVPVDPVSAQDAVHLVDDRGVAVKDVDAQVRAARAAMAKGDAALSVDDAGQPGEVCSCSHPFIIDDEPWIPQSVAAELMRLVADGKADPQAAADFLSGNYARTHSTWFHFTKSPRYYAAVDAIREAHSRTWGGTPNGGNTYAAMKAPGEKDANLVTAMPNPLGKLPGSVWEIATQPLKVPAELDVDHFAAFPMEFPRRIILGWSPSGICTACGEGRRPVVDKATRPLQAVYNGSLTKVPGAGRQDCRTGVPSVTEAVITGEACACPDTSAPTRPAVVLDPFGGTGTTALVAEALGRHGISVDMSADYLRLAAWRTSDPGERARALGVDKPPPVTTGQLDLFGGAA